MQYKLRIYFTNVICNFNFNFFKSNTNFVLCNMGSYMKTCHAHSSKVALAFLTKSTQLSTLSLVICVFYTLYAFLETSVEKTRISENALLPGLVDDLFDDSQMIALYTKRLRNYSDNHKFVYCN